MGRMTVLRKSWLMAAAVLAFGLLTFACERRAPRSTAIVMNWQPVDSLNARLPAGIRVFSGANEHVPLKAWYVVIDEPRPEIRTRVLVSDDRTDNRETVSSFAADEGAVVVMNGGYFVMGKTPTYHAGLLVSDGNIVAPATKSVVRNSLRYAVARAAIGFTPDDEVDITWVRSRHDTLFCWDTPPGNSEEKPADLDFRNAAVWHVTDAVAAGPMLVQSGKLRVATEAEVFFGSAIPNVHPRSAVGLTKTGKLIFMVVDGRQPESRGASLEELAALMLDVGAVQALNLDGGGSSALVVNGTLLNRPSGGRKQRQVMSALATFVSSDE